MKKENKCKEPLLTVESIGKVYRDDSSDDSSLRREWKIMGQCEIQGVIYYILWRRSWGANELWIANKYGILTPIDSEGKIRHSEENARLLEIA